MHYILRLAMTALLCLIASACSGDEEARSATPAATATGSSTAVSTAQSAEEAFSVTWEPVQASLFAPVSDQQRDVRTDNLRNRFPDVPDERFVWRVFAAAVGSEARLAYETLSEVWGASWVADDSQIALAQAGPTLTLVDARGSGAAPQRVDSAQPFHIASDGSKAASITGARELLLIDFHARTAARLRGLPGQLDAGSIRGWSADGSLLLVRSPMPEARPPTSPHQPADWFAVPATDGQAKRVGGQRPPGRIESAAWSPAKPAVLALLHDNGALSLFDASTGVSRELAAQGSFTRTRSPRWSRDADRIRVGDQFVDLRTAHVGTYRLPPEPRVDFAVSPDESLLVGGTLPSVGAPNAAEDCPFPPRQNRVLAIDQATGDARVLKACDERFFVSFQWVGDSDLVLMSGGHCYQCSTPNRRVSLIDARAGEEVPLTRGLEFMARSLVSPDERHILVTGESLRIYRADGLLLQQIDPPEGFSVTEAAWSTDGRRFAYVIGPTGVWGI